METSPEWRRIGYMTLSQAGSSYRFYSVLCWFERRFGRKLF